VPEIGCSDGLHDLSYDGEKADMSLAEGIIEGNPFLWIGVMFAHLQNLGNCPSNLDL